MVAPAVCHVAAFLRAPARVSAIAALSALACGGEGAGAAKAPASAGGTASAAGTPSGGSAAAATASSGGGGGNEAGAANVGAGGAGLGAVAGAAGSAGSAGALEGSAQRPQLRAARAAEHSVLSYLAQAGSVLAPVKDDWDPTGGVGDVSTLVPKFRVAVSGGTHTTVQAAISAAVAVGGGERIAIEVTPGTYREVVCVPSGAPPITLYGSASGAAATMVVFDNYNGKTKAAQVPANPCNPALGSTTYGTSGSATFAAYSAGFHAKNLTFANDTNETGIAANVQAVALATQGDKQIYENVRMLGNQDTFFVKSPSADVIARVYVKGSFIEGDTDFIFGRGTLVIDSSVIHFVSSRQGSKGYAIVPSTDARNPYGFLVYRSELTADAATAAGQVHLGRAWDESGKDLPTYVTQAATGVYPNGQALVRESTLGAHIRAADPWAEAATTKRPFSAVAGLYPANRLYELASVGPGAAK